MKKIILTLTLLTLFGCGKNVEEQLNGSWVIKEIKVDGRDFTNYLYVNSFGFDTKEQECWFHASAYFNEDLHAKWEVIKTAEGEIDSLNIKSSIKVYNDKFKVFLTNDGNRGQPQMKLVSHSVCIDAYKIF